MVLNSDGGGYAITEFLTARIKDYSFDTYFEHFLKTFPFLDKVASLLIEVLIQEPGLSEASEDEKILEVLISIIPFMNFMGSSDTQSRYDLICVCSSDLFDIFKKLNGESYTETEETCEFLFLAPKCHNLIDAFYFFAGLQG